MKPVRNKNKDRHLVCPKKRKRTDTVACPHMNGIIHKMLFVNNLNLFVQFVNLRLKLGHLLFHLALTLLALGQLLVDAFRLLEFLYRILCLLYSACRIGCREISRSNICVGIDAGSLSAESIVIRFLLFVIELELVQFCSQVKYFLLFP